MRHVSLLSQSSGQISRNMAQKVSLVINSRDKQVPAFGWYIIAAASHKRETFAKTANIRKMSRGS